MNKIQKAAARKKEAKFAFLQRAAKRKGIELEVLPTAICQIGKMQNIDQVRKIGGVTIAHSKSCYGCGNIPSACALVKSTWVIVPDGTVENTKITIVDPRTLV